MKSKKFFAARLAILATAVLVQPSAAMSADTDCRKRLMYDYCQGVMIYLAAVLSKEDGGAEVFDTAMTQFREVWSDAGFSTLPEHAGTGYATAQGFHEGSQDIALVCLGASAEAEAEMTRIALKVDEICEAN